MIHKGKSSRWRKTYIIVLIKLNQNRMEAMNIHQAKFYVDFAMEAGGESVCPRYWFTIDLSDDEFEELYQPWYDNDCNLNSWASDDKGHKALYEKIDGIAYHVLNDLLKKYEPQKVNPIDCYWEISKETADSF